MTILFFDFYDDAANTLLKEHLWLAQTHSEDMQWSCPSSFHSCLPKKNSFIRIDIPEGYFPE
jgi:hypothetical protein